MCQRLGERQKHIADAYTGAGKRKATTTDTDLFQRAGVKVRKE